MRCIKKPIPTQVDFAECSGTLVTLEGPVSFEEGDALMTGVAGERWPIRRNRFEATYEPISPTRMGQNGLYMKKPIPVSARQAATEESIDLPGKQGVLKAMAGDWIITAEDGRQWVVANKIFVSTYQAIE